MLVSPSMCRSLCLALDMPKCIMRTNGGSQKLCLRKQQLPRFCCTDGRLKKKSDILNFKHFQETKLYNYDRLIQGQQR